MTVESPVPCTCKGIRHCRLCLDSERVSQLRCGASSFSLYEEFAHHTCFIYRRDTGRAHRYSSDESNKSPTNITLEEVAALSKEPPTTNDESVELPGLLLIEEFLSEAEEGQLMENIDASEWLPSQSGRRKQDYGPKVNFKRQKIKMDGHFHGLPRYTDIVLRRLEAASTAHPSLADFRPVELCNLEYVQSRGSSIDLHKDDDWVWGPRLVSVNLLADCVMTFEGGEERLIFVNLPRRSLLVVDGEARALYRHGIFPHHITNRRCVTTLREAAKAFREGGHLYEGMGRELLRLGAVRLHE